MEEGDKREIMRTAKQRWKNYSPKRFGELAFLKNREREREIKIVRESECNREIVRKSGFT